MRTDTPQPIYLKDYRPPAYLIERIDLDIALDPNETRVTSRLAVRPNGAPDAPGGPLVLNGEDLSLRAICLDGERLTADAYAITETTLTLLDTPDRPFVLDIVNTVDPDANTRLMGLYRSNGTYCTQCEAEGFRRITYFVDRPDILSVYTTRLEADAAEVPVLLSNGNLMEAGGISGTDRHFAIWHDPHPKPAYLFALVGGDLAVLSDRFVTASGREVALNIYVEHGKTEDCRYAMDALKRSMKWDEDAFGREYDLDVFNIVAVSDFNMGAMENKGLNIFNDKYVLARPNTATDQDYANIEAIIAHEYFHNWTGNRITCRDWFQLCLKEGLTVFRDQEFSADMRSAAVKRIQDVRALRAQQFPEDAGPLAHPVRPASYLEINNFYTATVYEKGAEIIRMLKTLIGADAFKRGMDVYFERHDGDAATVDQFLTCFAEASGSDLDKFARWYDQAGTPEISLACDYDAEARTLRLSARQTIPPTPGQDEKQPMPTPLRLGLVASDGSAIALDTDSGLIDGDTAILDGVDTTITFKNVDEYPVVSAFRGFSAPVRISQTLSTAERLRLARHDDDPFNRWQALQDLALGELIAATGRIQDGADPQFGASLGEAMISGARDDGLEPAFRALLLTLPSEADIAREIRKDIDPDAIYQARRRQRLDLTQSMASAWEDLYLEAGRSLPETYAPDAAQAGRRAFRNAVLSHLALSADGSERAMKHFEAATNMTDRMAALSILVAGDDREAADDALAAFYDTYRNDPLIIDKWFAVQATATHDDTPSRVAELMHHPAFSLKTPNRVRSLIGSFAMANQRQFNSADGHGFDLVVDVVVTLNQSNPQVAARLLSAFRSWRALEPVRRGLAESALRRVADRSDLTPDVRDIVDRTLNG